VTATLDPTEFVDPFGVAVDPVTNTVFVANSDDGTVSVIDGATNTVAATVSVGGFLPWISLDPVSHALYVAAVRDNLSVITPQFSLAIAQPANVTSNATGPAGAAVSFPSPAVTDSDGTSPPVHCAPGRARSSRSGLPR
jgi:YVTN family beta-propeller protein